MNIAVCDNNRNACNEILRLIRKDKPTAKIFTFTSAETLLDAPEDFSIYFLDIRGVSGLEIARNLRARQNLQGKPKSILIFITGYREYMAEAFDVNAFHYILKPIDTKKFSQVLARACHEVEESESRAEKYLLLKVGGVHKKFYLRNIFFIESNNKKVIVHTSDGNFEAAGKMDSLEVALSDCFYRCHRCYLVNLEKISAYTANTIQLTGGDEIFIAAKKYSAFVKTYLRYAKEGGGVNV